VDGAREFRLHILQAVTQLTGWDEAASVASVGWVERGETHRITSGNATVMANYRRSFLAGGSYFFTANLADRRRVVDRKHWPAAGGVSPGASTASLYDRRRRDPARSSAYDLDPTGGPCGFRPPLAPDQERVFAQFAARRAGLQQPRRQRRAGGLAAAVLGAYLARPG